MRWVLVVVGVLVGGVLLGLLYRSARPPASPRRQVVSALLALCVLALAAVVIVQSSQATTKPVSPPGPTALSGQLIGRQTDGSIITPSNQRLTPAGTQVEFAGRPTAVALRPDGQTAAALVSQGALIVVTDLRTGRVLQQFMPTRQGSFTGVVYDPDGRHLTASRANGTLLRVTVTADGTLADPTTIRLPSGRGLADPGGLAVSEDGSTLYVVLSRYNSLGVVDLSSGRLTAQIPVENAPHDVVLSRGKAYVTNQGGRVARPGDRTNNSSGTDIVSDPTTGGPATGTVSVVDLTTKQSVSLAVGIQPTGEYLSGNDLFVTNSSSDTISVIDIDANAVLQTIDVKPMPGAPLGSQPNAVTMDDRHDLIVSLGRNNALAVYNWQGPRRETKFLGLIPTGWFPGSVAISGPLHRLVVANDLGVGSLGPTKDDGGHSSGAFVGSLSLINLPLDSSALGASASQVLANNGLSAQQPPGRPMVGPPPPTPAPVPVPVHLGDPSSIHHIFYIIKENRTYDQVLGDVSRGNGDAKLASFGAAVTPNQHALTERFPLLDNFYASGAVSADGHQWDLQATVPDYLEKAYGGYTRSYPAKGGDALAYTQSGFLWGNVLAHGKTFADFGEYASSFTGPQSSFGTWSDWYHDYLKLSGAEPGQPHVAVGSFQTHSDVPQLDPLLIRDYPNFNLRIPDQYRELIFERQFQQWVKGANLPDVVVVYLPNDHTAASASGEPTPSAMIADNDVALGKTVDAISHSPYWKDSAIFVTEDDAQAGTDHVDGHRTVGYVISPWTTSGSVSHGFYTQTNMIKTMEQILGLPAMNQMDLAAEPMFDLFGSTPDDAPFSALPTKIPLDQMNPDGGGTPGNLEPTAPLNSPIALIRQQQWRAESEQMGFADWNAAPDVVDPVLLDHAIWYATTGYSTPYPGDTSVVSPKDLGHPAGAKPPLASAQAPD